MAAENSNRSILKTYTSTSKNTFTLLTLPSFSTYVFSADITPEMLKLGRVTNVKVFLLVLVYVFDFS